jgi:hypothetical protein
MTKRTKVKDIEAAIEQFNFETDCRFKLYMARHGGYYHLETHEDKGEEAWRTLLVGGLTAKECLQYVQAMINGISIYQRGSHDFSVDVV